MVTREQIVSTAREYKETPFQHQGRIKGHGLDCVGLPLCVAAELKMKDKSGKPFLRNDSSKYGPQPLDRFVHEECQRRLIEVPIEEMDEGCVLTMRVPKIPCHVAIVCKTNGVWGIVHAYAGSRKVVEHELTKKWRDRVEGCFKFPEIA